ncbi:hypothetical protein [Nitrosovibrio sp. Nv17]|uniref:hypothetical protein n=1 Tax=Nitrosovibrio sp. Nv17 TaxID=1855339 RepID=UPI001160D40D|nr:hypothetical protein [Nitrosovibrio sp. Nv17]
MAQLEAVLNRVQLEQQAIYQQFQMTQELRRSLIQEGGPMQAGPTITGGLKDHPPPSYDDQVKLQRERQARIERYGHDLDSLHARYAELAERRQALLDQLIELVQPPQP